MKIAKHASKQQTWRLDTHS